MPSRKNWIRQRRMARRCAVLLLLAGWLLNGCPPQKPNATVYVPEVDQLFFVKPGDLITDANGLLLARIPYKGVVLSNQMYLQLLDPPDHE